jgi:hypothetical protein
VNVVGGSVMATSVTVTGGGGITGNLTGNVTGNASSVTNGIYSSGSYADPAWLTSLSGTKISGTVADATNATSAAGVASGSGVPHACAWVNTPSFAVPPAGGGATFITVSCPAGTTVVAGSCQSGGGSVIGSFPVAAAAGWHCDVTAGGIIANAYCCHF